MRRSINIWEQKQRVKNMKDKRVFKGGDAGEINNLILLNHKQ